MTAERSEHTRTALRSPFVVLTGLSASLVVVLGCATNLRDTFHLTLIAAWALAYVPLVVAAPILFVLLVAVVCKVGYDALRKPGIDVDALEVELKVRHAERGLLAWYRRVKDFMEDGQWLGLPAGAVLGGLVCYALVAIFIVPHEERTTALLLQAQVQIEQAYEREGRYPAPTLSGQKQGFRAGSAGLLHDDFGQLVEYQLSGRWKMRSYTLRSLGADGIRSDDDLCVDGQMRLARVLNLGSMVVNVSAWLLGNKDWEQKAEMIQSLYCKD